jgi:hypothetical protein
VKKKYGKGRDWVTKKMNVYEKKKYGEGGNGIDKGLKKKIQTTKKKILANDIVKKNG